ncbi:hypothetical protein FKP32DRAFT_1674502 [Trametes sanguinea]|nr:hypothetical protein FKP32DRAFT_1674502 [Trametes sanguinea]
MALSPDSRDLLLSIFKAKGNARRAWEWRDFLKLVGQAMSELGFVVEQVDGVIFHFKAPDRWHRQVLDHQRRLEKSDQNRLARRLSRKFGWCASTFRTQPDA